MSYFSLFQSPHPVRGATGSRSCWPPSQCHFNPRTPRGVRRDTGIGPHGDANFNPRTPRGVRRRPRVETAPQAEFQSTHPARGATWARLFQSRSHNISIHAPREGCDEAQGVSANKSSYFNPRTPRGVRPALRACLSEPSVISIHAPREGCDQSRRADMPSVREFQSTHPARGATWSTWPPTWPLSNFNPRTPRGVRLALHRGRPRHRPISIHAPREGCDCQDNYKALVEL